MWLDGFEAARDALEVYLDMTTRDWKNERVAEGFASGRRVPMEAA
jgi:hypothetical protein